MQWGKRGPGSPSMRRRAAFRPDSEPLEGRRLLASFDLSMTQTAPYGVEMVGKASENIAGYTVTDVGNVTGSGYDSFTVAATGDANTTVGNKPLNPTFSNPSAVYLVFGSKQVNINTVASYLTLAAGVPGTTTSGALVSGRRAGDLGELGTLGVGTQTDITNPTAQTNPTVFQPQPAQAATHVYGFNFDGITFVTSGSPADGLGYSVAALGNLSGNGNIDSFAISAPNDGTGGRVFVIYGGTQLASQTVANKTIDLESTAGTISTSTPTKVVAFYDSLATATSEVGFSVAGLGNYFGTSSYTRDLAIGAPGFNPAGIGANTGAVFTVAGNYINTLQSGANIDLNTLYSGSQTTSANSISGIEYTGFTAGGEVGYSVSTAGNFDGAIGTNGDAIDDLLIGAPGTAGGRAYLVYGKQPFLDNALIGSTQPLTTLGQPLVTTTGAATNALQGSIFFDNTLGDGFGSTVATAGDFNNDGVDDIMIGAPYYSPTVPGDTGFVSVVYGLKGTYTNLTTTRLNQLYQILPMTTTAVGTAPAPTSPVVTYIGAGPGTFTGFSIAPSPHLQIGTSTAAEPISDILIAAPGGTGTAYLVPGTAAGATVTPGMKSLSTINSTLNGNAFTDAGTGDVAITAGGFATSVSARNLVVDPEPTTTFNTVDPDEIPDLYFGAPFSTLNNPNNIITPERTLAGVAYVVEGSLLGGVAGTGSSTTTTTTSSASTNAATTNSVVNALQPVAFTGDDQGLPNPPITALTHLNSYAPLPVQLAYQQFLPKPGFLAREQVALHPSQKAGSHNAAAGTKLNVAAIGHSENTYDRHPTLKRDVFTRGKTKVGVKTTFTHKVKVIPTSLQTETYPG